MLPVGHEETNNSAIQTATNPPPTLRITYPRRICFAAHRQKHPESHPATAGHCQTLSTAAQHQGDKLLQCRFSRFNEIYARVQKVCKCQDQDYQNQMSGLPQRGVSRAVFCTVPGASPHPHNSEFVIRAMVRYQGARTWTLASESTSGQTRLRLRYPRKAGKCKSVLQ